MYRHIILAALLITPANLLAQDAATLAAQREREESQRRMSTTISRLEESNLAFQRRINELANELANVRRQLIEFESRYKNAQLGAVTQSDLRKIYDTIEKVEKNRQADNELVKSQFVELKKILDKPPVIVATPPVDKPTRNIDKPQRDEITPLPNDDPPTFTGDYFPYTIKSGDNLLKIIGAYNEALKAEGNTKKITLDAVKKANPKMNPNNLKVGAEIKIPKP
jgi:hypothetical protein